VIRSLGLQKTAQSLYFRFAQRGDSLQISAGGVAGRFVSPNIGDLRTMESCAQEPVLARILSEVRPEDIVYDIGAHQGVYAILLAQRVERVVAFEPEQVCYIRLQQNIQNNGLSNITSFCKALGDRDAQEILYLEKGIGTINSGQLDSEWTEGPRQTITVVRGDTFRQSQKLPVPTVVKIDVEGYESFVLEGFRESLIRPECRLVCCEIHPNLLPPPATKETVVNTLKDLGFFDIQIFPHNLQFHAFAHKRF
jgi:FkbM family methyltransferase